MSQNLLHKTIAAVVQPLFQLAWLCFALTLPWLALAIGPYLWAMVSLVLLYAALPLWLLVAVELFRLRQDRALRPRLRNALLLASGAAGHLALHLLWVLQSDWRF